MTTPEQAAWDNLRPVLAGAGLDPRRVENVVGPGHPDVNYAGGDIELKAMSGFPLRQETLVKVPEFTGEQAGWLAQRWKAQGLSWLMVRVGREWFLFDGWTTLDVWRGMTEPEWRERAAFCLPEGENWGGYPDKAGLHPYSRQLHCWLRYELDRMMPHSRALAMRLRSFIGNDRVTPLMVATDLNWLPQRVTHAEQQGVSSSDVGTLLDYWNS